jgi:uncharacterized protein YbaR (Trm112 family)
VDKNLLDILVCPVCKGLLQSELSVWKRFRQDRSITSHTYDDTKAQEVFEHIPLFLKEAECLLANLQKRNNDDKKA